MTDATMQPNAAFEWLTIYQQFLEAVPHFYESLDGVPYDPTPGARALVADALWKAVVQGMEETSPEAIREVAAMSPADWLDQADKFMRVVGLHRRKRRTGLENLTKAEAIIADLARRFGPLPR